MFIDFFAWIGWAYDLKTVSPKLLSSRIHRTGDGSHQEHGNKLHEESHVNKVKCEKLQANFSNLEKER